MKKVILIILQLFCIANQSLIYAFNNGGYSTVLTLSSKANSYLESSQRDTINVLLIGDSTTFGLVPRLVKPYSPHLDDIMEIISEGDLEIPLLNVYNSSMGGETALSIIEKGRYKREVANLKESDINYIFIRYGINDFSKNKNFKNDFYRNLKNLILLLQKDFPQAKIVPMTIIPFMSHEKCMTVNNVVTKVAKELRLDLCDIYTPYKKAVDTYGFDAFHVRRIELENIDEKLHPILKNNIYKQNRNGKSIEYVLADDNSLDPIMWQYKEWFKDPHPNLAGYYLIAKETVCYLKKKYNKDNSSLNK